MWANFHNFHYYIRKGSVKDVGIKTITSPEICCRSTLWNVSDHQYSFTFILATIVCVMSGQWRIQDVQTRAGTRRHRRRGVGCGEEVSPLHLSTGEGIWEGPCPSEEKNFEFGSQNGDFRCILDTVFYSSRRRRDVGMWGGFLNFCSWNSVLWSILAPYS